MKKVAAGVMLGLCLTTFLLVGTNIKAVRACSCVSISSEQAFQLADAVFVGNVTRIDAPIPITSSIDPVEVTLKIQSVLKGSLNDTALVHTVASGDSCGYEFQVGGQYRVYAYTRDNRLETNLCSGTVLLAYTPLTEPNGASENNGPSNPPMAFEFVILLVAAGIASLLVLLLVGKRPRPSGRVRNHGSP